MDLTEAFSTMKGPHFLALYAGLFLLILCSVWVLRVTGHDTPMVTLLGFAIFELVGGLRIVLGSAHGLHRWEFLLIMMIFGGILFFIRFTFTSGNSHNGSCGSGGSSCGGGGGGGCGGGGCGGCGGS